MGTQKNCLNETILLGTQNICKKLWVKEYKKIYTEHFCLSKPVKKEAIFWQFHRFWDI